ncbi:polypyrimidine tract-binding protein 3 isoform X1 [Histomonas meleagridis]|uniref:polypyrimidine tract-binding protein-like 3 isoform X1 n=1 Tax=Histomonas meleagridis TaxID=135588 RepID=UPI00355966F8|nr:polypyrimidine tract-binding protein 3 isoform X1 [Histomonas meleagridis]KAH0801124.1 polypyrimidine tract-binding protein-like 3 isoform X1 [Histomonas meleagridis]
MRGKIVNPWDCPPAPDGVHRLIHLSNLPPLCNVSDLSPIFQNYQIEYYHLFENQALVQFADPYLAQNFLAIYRDKLTIQDYPIKVSMSPITHLIFSAGTKMAPSPVICIQVINLRVYLGIQDIYDECSHFGKVLKIICFEKAAANSFMQPIGPEQPVKYALVQMATIEQASLVLANLSNSPRHLPCFQFRIQYSKNHDIVIKFNNSKSYDFTDPYAKAQFTQLREATAGERPFFVFEPNSEIDSVFDFWRPVIFDPSFVRTLTVSNYNENTITFDKLRNLFCQYGPVQRVRFFYKTRKTSIITFRNSFYPRLAMTFLQGCPVDSTHRLVIECTPQHPNFQVREYNDHSGQDYGYYEEDLDLDDYKALSFPSQYVIVKRVDIKQIQLPQGAELLEELNLIKFQNVYEAANFIMTCNRMVIGKEMVQMAFAQKPNGIK